MSMMEKLDIISKNKLIAEIDEKIDCIVVKDTYSKGKINGLKTAKILAEEQSGWYKDENGVFHQKKNYYDNWIMDRLPENDVDVLVCFEYFRYGEYNRLFQARGISYAHAGQWSGFVNGSSGWKQLRILAWQPLPPIPESIHSQLQF